MEVLHGVILPSFNRLIELQKRKKIIAGGLPVGDRAVVFIAEAKFNDELDQMLRILPMWGKFDWEVTTLQTFYGRAKQERQVVRDLKRAIREK